VPTSVIRERFGEHVEGLGVQNVTLLKILQLSLSRNLRMTSDKYGLRNVMMKRSLLGLETEISLPFPSNVICAGLGILSIETPWRVPCRINDCWNISEE